MYRACRARGETVRKLIDCLIGAVAVAAEIEVLHADADFETLARHTDLRAHPAERR
jgi:predicted nucleic acid-binding protein